MNTTPGANTPGPATSAPASSPAPGPSNTPASSPASPGSGHGADPGTRTPEAFRSTTPSHARGPSTPEQVRPIIERSQAEPQRLLDPSEVATLLSFDTFFANPSHTGQPNSAIDPAPVAPAPAAPAAPEVPREPAASALPQNPQAFVDAVREVVGQNQPQAPQQPQTTQPYYGGTVAALEVTPELFGAIMNAENPQQSHQAMNHLVNALANRTMEDMHRSMLSAVKAMMTAIPKMIPSHIQASTFQDRFYGKFSELNKPMFQEMVKTIAGTLAKKRRDAGQPLDDSFMDEVGEAAHKFLETATGKSFRPTTQIAPTPPQTTPVAAPASPPRESFYTNGSSHRHAAATPNGQGNWLDLVL